MNRTMDAERLNALANHPEVRPWLFGPEGPLYLTPLVENPAVVTLEAEHGAFMLIPLSDTLYELHTMFLPEGRGVEFFGHAAEMFRYVFTRTPCLEVVTKVPDENRAAAVAATRAGMRQRFHRAGISFRSLTIEQWALQDEQCLEEGERFHEALEAAKEACGSTLPVHDDDPVHDHIVGSCLLMAYAGNLEKGVECYNRWAIYAGYATIGIVAPNLIDVRDAIIEVRDGRLGVLKCRSAPLLGLQELEEP